MVSRPADVKRRTGFYSPGLEPGSPSLERGVSAIKVTPPSRVFLDSLRLNHFCF
jgi:hypothetical protein